MINNKKILINTFITSGFLGWAELFLESLRFHHGEEIHVLVNGLGLEENEVTLLKNIYGNIEVDNRPIDYQQAAQELGVDINTFHNWRREIERGGATDENYLFKIFVSVNQRYRSMDKVINDARNNGYELLLHSDADMYIRKPINNLFQIMEKHDVTLLLRNMETHRLKVFGGLLGFNLKANIDPFLNTWMNEIDKVKFKERWMGFGQSVIWFALEKSENLNVGNLNNIPDAPKFSKTFDKEHEIWLGNSKVLKPVKVTSLPLCWQDYKDQLPRVKMEKATAYEKYRNKLYALYRESRKWLKKKAA